MISCTTRKKDLELYLIGMVVVHSSRCLPHQFQMIGSRFLRMTKLKSSIPQTSIDDAHFLGADALPLCLAGAAARCARRSAALELNSLKMA